MTDSKQAGIAKDILKTIDALEDLPSFPNAILKLNEKIADQGAGIGDFAAIIESDIALTAHILKLVNSPFYISLGGEVTSVRQALVRIGISEVQNVCMAFGAVNMFSKTSERVPLKSFWQHSLSCALLSKEIVAKLGFSSSDMELAFTAGLFHDVGIFLLDIHFSDLFQEVVKDAAKTHRSTLVVEDEKLGLNHAYIAARVFKRWNLSERLINIVENHHTPDRCPAGDKILCQAVHIADFIVASQGAFENSVHLMPDSSSEGAWHDLGLDVSDTPDLLRLAQLELERAEQFLGISQS